MIKVMYMYSCNFFMKCLVTSFISLCEVLDMVFLKAFLFQISTLSDGVLIKLSKCRLSSVSLLQST